MTQSIVRHPLKVDRTPIVNGKLMIGGLLPQRIKTWFNQEFGTVHTIVINNKPWFMGTEVARILEYSDPNRTIKHTLKDKYKKSVDITNQNLHLGDYNHVNPITPIRVFINLSGLLTLIGKSRMPKAEDFRDWINEEVIPSIYQTGAYITDERMSRIDNNPQEMEKLVKEVKQVKAENEQLKPLAHYAQTTLKSDEALTFTVVAKEFGWTSQQLHKFLEQQKVIFTKNKRKQTKVWQPHRKYANFGLFTFQTYTYSDRSDKVHSSTTLYITQKGRLEIHKILLHHGFKPLAV